MKYLIFIYRNVKYEAFHIVRPCGIILIYKVAKEFRQRDHLQKDLLLFDTSNYDRSVETILVHKH